MQFAACSARSRALEKKLALFVVGATALLAGSSSYAVPIAVNNASFEANVVADGGFLLAISGWTIGPGVSTTPAGTGNPTVGQYAAQAPDGLNVAFSKDATISQILSAVLTANTTYTLNVDVGHRLDNPVFPGYSVQFRAGGVTLASESALSPVAGSFLTSTVVFSTGASSPQIGQALQILLDVTPAAAPAGDFYQVNFDNVRLSAVPISTSVPEPASIALLALGLAGLGFRRRK